MPRSALSAPVTLLVTRHIQPERYGDFLAWMRQGEILAAGFPASWVPACCSRRRAATSTRSCCASTTRPAWIAGNVRRRAACGWSAARRWCAAARCAAPAAWTAGSARGQRAAALEAGGQHLAGLLPAAADVLGAAGRTAGGPADVLARAADQRRADAGDGVRLHSAGHAVVATLAAAGLMESACCRQLAAAVRVRHALHRCRARTEAVRHAPVGAERGELRLQRQVGRLGN